MEFRKDKDIGETIGKIKELLIQAGIEVMLYLKQIQSRWYIHAGLNLGIYLGLVQMARELLKMLHWLVHILN